MGGPPPRSPKKGIQTGRNRGSPRGKERQADVLRDVGANILLFSQTICAFVGICTPARATVATDRGVRQSLRPFAGRFSQRRNSAHREVSPENRPLTRRPAESSEKNAQRSEKTRGLSSKTREVSELSPRVFNERRRYQNANQGRKRTCTVLTKRNK